MFKALVLMLAGAMGAAAGIVDSIPSFGDANSRVYVSRDTFLAKIDGKVLAIQKTVAKSFRVQLRIDSIEPGISDSLVLVALASPNSQVFGKNEEKIVYNWQTFWLTKKTESISQSALFNTALNQIEKRPPTTWSGTTSPGWITLSLFLLLISIALTMTFYLKQSESVIGWWFVAPFCLLVFGAVILTAGLLPAIAYLVFFAAIFFLLFYLKKRPLRKKRPKKTAETVPPAA